MGAAVSNWRLARAVAQSGQMGVVSGTALDLVLARRLQDGDPGGHMRRALAALPLDGVAERMLREWFLPQGRAPGQPYKPVPMYSYRPRRSLIELTVAANFVEVFLAREGHDGPVGINLLEKIALPNLPSLYGAMLAGVHYVLMGAGIPNQIPPALDRLARHESATLRLSVEGAASDDLFEFCFEPQHWFGSDLAPLHRPYFLAVVASHVLAASMVRRCVPPADGLVLEGPTAGGHNAPPRGAMQLNERGEPVYGERDLADPAAVAQLGVPFWLAGSYGTPERLACARSVGARGVQVGTVFAFCVESGLDDTLRRRALEQVLAGDIDVLTDPHASPTGFPFKVVRLSETISEQPVYEARRRQCDLGYLRRLYKRPDGALGFRCPAESVAKYVKKGGAATDTVGRKCLCNGLMANIGLTQRRPWNYLEPALLTAGDELCAVRRFIGPGRLDYRARDVLDWLLPEREDPSCAR